MSVVFLHRLNPNLYPTGKICLSLLGTWAGHDTENWSPESTLLQVSMRPPLCLQYIDLVFVCLAAADLDPGPHFGPFPLLQRSWVRTAFCKTLLPSLMHNDLRLQVRAVSWYGTGRALGAQLQRERSPHHAAGEPCCGGNQT